MTDTPETDAMEYCDAMCDPDRVVEADFARKLERERDEARETCSELVTDSDAITLPRTVVRITQDCDEARNERDELIRAGRALKTAKGRFHTEQAATNLFNFLP